MPRIIHPDDADYFGSWDRRHQQAPYPQQAAQRATPQVMNAGPDGVSFNAGVDACRAALKKRGLQVDATGTYRVGMSDDHLGEVAGRGVTHGCLARALWFTMRSHGQRIGEATLQTIFAELAMREAEQRYRFVTSRMLGTAATDAGRDLVRCFVQAITPSADDLDVGAVMQWLWQVKRRLAGLPTQEELMLLISGAKQGTGKSTALRKLVEPLAELVIDVSSYTFSDEREAEVMATHAIGILDDMARVNATEAADIKRTITQPTVAYRRMRENGRVTAKRLMSFIGTANEPLALLVNDTTGARRFHELTVAVNGRIDRDAINAIDYRVLWTAVSELDPAPILPLIERLRDRQQALVARDAVSGWLEDETWGAVVWNPPGAAPVVVDAYDPQVGEPCALTRARFLLWCAQNGQKGMDAARLGNRLTTLGFENRQSRFQDRRCRHYFIPDAIRMDMTDAITADASPAES
jgi:Virulence-associated protein E